MHETALLLILGIFLFSTNQEIPCKGEYDNNNLKDGFWQCYYEDSIVQEEGLYKNGKKEGLWKFYHVTGKTALEGHYKQNKEIGVWRVFDEEGLLMYEIDYNE